MATLSNKPPKNPHGIFVIGGDRYDTWKDKQRVEQITVELTTDEASQAELKVYDPRFYIIDRYSDGKSIPALIVLVYLGFGEDLGPPVFKGLLQDVERGANSSTFIAYDMGYKMRQRENGEYHKGNDLDILKNLATRNGLKFEGPEKVDPPLEHHPSMIQGAKHDWDFAMERAREAGFNVFVRQDTLFVKEPAKITAPIFTLRYRKDFWLLDEYDMKYSTPENERGRPKIVEHRGRKRGGKRLTGKSKAHDRGHEPIEFRHDPSEHTQIWMNRRAHSHKELNREPAWNGTIRSVPPLPGIRPDVRNTIGLENMGKHFSGLYICDRVRHELTGNAFATDYTLYRDVD